MYKMSKCMVEVEVEGRGGGEGRDEVVYFCHIFVSLVEKWSTLPYQIVPQEGSQCMYIVYIKIS